MTSYNYFTKFIKNLQDTKRIDLAWDTFTSTGDKLKTFKQLNGPDWALDKEEIIASFPDNYEDYNVMILKSITGKDYEQCYQEYDDPLEWDIQNIENIGGGISIILNSYPREHMNFYKRSDYSIWLKQYSIREEFVLPVPIGKVVEDNANLKSIKSSSNYYNTDDSPGVIKPYRRPRIELL